MLFNRYIQYVVEESRRMKRILGIVALFMGVVMLAGTFVVSFSQQKVSTVKLSSASKSAVFTTTAPGVLTLVNDVVAVTLESKGHDVQWALGTPADVKAFVGGAGSVDVAGLESWKALKVAENKGSAEANTAVKEAVGAKSFTLLGSDMWAKEGHAKNSANVELKASDLENKVLIATTDQGVAPKITLEWQRIHEVANLLVFYVMSVLLGLIGAFLLLNWHQEEAARTCVQRKASVKLRSRGQSDEATSVLPSYDGDLADPDLERDIQRVHTDAAFGAAILPGTIRSSVFRNRELAEEDRIIIPTADTDSVETPDRADDTAQEAVSEPVLKADVGSGDDEEEKMDERSEKDDWRSLWNFSWGTPWKKEEGNTNA